MRTCIFCGNTVNSKEDVWPLWLVRRLGNTETGIIEGQRGRQIPYSWRVGKYPLRTGNVCKDCNSGWMSDLENRVKLIIERFLFDKQVSLNQLDQTDLAIWTCKNAMIYEALRHESPWFFTFQERKSLREAFQLPPLTSIWIAKSIGFKGLFFSASDLNGIIAEPLDQVKAHVTTLGFGPLAIQILNAKMLKPISQVTNITGDSQPGPWNQTIIQIWPINDDNVSWPNAVGLNGEFGLDSFSQRWKPIG